MHFQKEYSDNHKNTELKSCFSVTDEYCMINVSQACDISSNYLSNIVARIKPYNSNALYTLKNKGSKRSFCNDAMHRRTIFGSQTKPFSEQFLKEPF